MKIKQRGSLTFSDLAAIVTIVIAAGSLSVGAVFWMFKTFDPLGSANAVGTALILSTESMTQRARLHYEENIREGKLVEQSEGELDRLEWNEFIIDEQKKALGLPVDEKEDK